MNSPELTFLGLIVAVAAGNPVFARTGDHTLTCSVAGTGALSATVNWQGSNDLLSWVTIGTVSLSGNDLVSGGTVTAATYAYWRLQVSALTGTAAAVRGTVVTESGSSALGVPLVQDPISKKLFANGVDVTSSVSGGGITLVPTVSATVNRTLLQAALDAADAAGGGIVRIAAGSTYEISGSVSIGSRTTLDLQQGEIGTSTGINTNIIVTKSYEAAWQTGGVMSWSAAAPQLAQVAHTAHGLAVNDYVITQGVLPSEFLIVARVTAVADANNFTLTMWVTGTAAPTGTLQWKKCVYRPKIINGRVRSRWIGAGNLASMGIMMAHAVGARCVDLEGVGCRKYFIFAFGVDDFEASASGVDTQSDGCHIFGPARNCRMRVSGSFGDDAMAVSSRDLIGNYVDITAGDVLDVEANGAHGESTTAMLQIFSHAGYRMDGIRYVGSSGLAPNHLSIFADPTDGGLIGSLTVVDVVASSRCLIDYFSGSAAGFAIKTLKFERYKCTPKSDTLKIFETGVNSVGVENLIFENCQVDAATAWGASGEGIFLNANCTLRNVKFQGGYFRGGANALIVKSVGSNNARNWSFSGCVFQGIKAVFQNATTSTDNPKVAFSDCSFVTMVDAVQLNNNANVSFRDCSFNTFTGAKVRVLNAAATAVEMHETGSRNVTAVTAIIKTAGNIRTGKTAGVECDITLLDRIDGTQVYNTNAAANNGTDGAVGAGPFVCIGTASGSWKRLGTVGGAANQY